MACVHHWMIERNGDGRCRECGEERRFQTHHISDETDIKHVAVVFPRAARLYLRDCRELERLAEQQIYNNQRGRGSFSAGSYFETSRIELGGTWSN